MRSLPAATTAIKNTLPVKDVETTPSCFQTVPKHSLAGTSAADSKLARRDLEQNKTVGTFVDRQQSLVANGSLCHNKVNHSPFSTSNSSDCTSLKACHSNCQSTSPSVKSEHQETLQNSAANEKSTTVMSVEVTKSKASAQASA